MDARVAPFVENRSLDTGCSPRTRCAYEHRALAAVLAKPSDRLLKDVGLSRTEAESLHARGTILGRIRQMLFRKA